MTEWKESLARMNDTAKLLSTLGLCVKAGKVTMGVPITCEALRKKTGNVPVIVLEAADTSDNTHKKLTDKCTFYKTELIRLEVGGEQLASAVGKSAYLGAVGITDKGLGALIKKYI